MGRLRAEGKRVFKPLTQKQQMVFHYLIATAMGEKQIAAELGIQRSAVAQTAKFIYVKKGVTGRIELMHQEIVRLIGMLGEAEIQRLN